MKVSIESDGVCVGNVAALIAMGSVWRFYAKPIREDINSLGTIPLTCLRTDY